MLSRTTKARGKLLSPLLCSAIPSAASDSLCVCATDLRKLREMIGLQAALRFLQVDSDQEGFL